MLNLIAYLGSIPERIGRGAYTVVTTKASSLNMGADNDNTLPTFEPHQINPTLKVSAWYRFGGLCRSRAVCVGK